MSPSEDSSEEESAELWEDAVSESVPADLPAHTETLARIVKNKICYNLVKIKPHLDCNYTFLIDLAPNRIPFGTKSIS